MHWSIVAIAAYLSNAGVGIVDKFLLKRLIPHPAVLAFFVSLMGGAVIVAAPFVLEDPSARVIATSAVSGFAFAGALFFYYSALKWNEASRVIPLVGSLTPVSVFIFASLFLGETLGVFQLLGFALVVIGTAILAEEGNARAHLTMKVIALGLLAAALFGISHVAAKYLYTIHPFGSGIVWRGVASIVAAFLLFLVPANRRRIVAELSDKEVKTEGIFLLGQAFAGAGFLLFNYALSLGPVTLVNALSGVQYAFLFLATIVLSHIAPKVMKEPLSRRELILKSVGIAVVALGLAVIFVI